MAFTFKRTIGLTKQTVRGIPIGEYLVVSYSIGDDKKYQIYRLHDGKLFIPTIFTSLDDCQSVARWMNETYQDYFPLWEEYPNMDIPAVTRWSIKNGIQLFTLLQELKQDKIATKPKIDELVGLV